MIKISTIIITKNEEDNIRNCLETVKWADEIIVVDDFSHDKTLDIVREYTGRIYRQEWLGYGRQKQFAVDKATGEWILSIDADERVTSELKSEILDAVKAEEFCGFYIPFKFFFLGHLMRFGGCGREKHLRLFRKDKGRFDEEAVHEGINVDGELGKLKNYILHFSYKDKEDYFKKFREYTSLDAEKRFNLGKKAGWGHIILLPCWEFISRFIFKLGFLDGVYGLQWALYSAQYVYVKYLKLIRLYNENRT